jgi:hypothetical protein
MTQEKGLKLETLIDRFTKEEEVRFNCPCGGKTSKLHQEICSVASAIVIQLVRFSFGVDNDGQLTTKKRSDTVSIPNILYFGEPRTRPYRLKSVVHHLGEEANSGHNICDVLQDGEWIRIDDRKVGPALENRFAVPYILFYEEIPFSTINYQQLPARAPNVQPPNMSQLTSHAAMQVEDSTVTSAPQTTMSPTLHATQEATTTTHDTVTEPQVHTPPITQQSQLEVQPQPRVISISKLTAQEIKKIATKCEKLNQKRE